MSDLRMLVREILAAELEKMKQPDCEPSGREEIVSISNNAELSAFVKRVASMAQDGEFRMNIESDKYVFKLAKHGSKPPEAHQPHFKPVGQVPTIRIERGLITEKEVKKFPEGLKNLSIGRTVRFTPLANDEIRQRNIKVERVIS